jgi:hypothetical protein
MADEQLRMTAEVVDKFSKPLRDLQKALREVKQPPAAREMREQFAGVSKAANEAAQAIRGGFGAAVGALGVSSLTAAGAIAAVVASIKGMTSATSELKAFSRETGLSTQRLRELEALGDRFQIAPDSVKSGVQAFSAELYNIRRRYGETYGWLHATAPQFAEQLVGSKSIEEAVGRALGYLAKIKDPHERQVFSEKLFGSGVFGRFGAEGFAKLQEQLADVQKSIGKLPAGAEDAAEKFERSLKSLGDTLRGIRDEFGAELLPGLNKELEELRAEVAKPELKAFVNDFAKELSSTTKDLIGFIKELKDGLSWFYERSVNPVKKLSPDELAKANREFYTPKIDEARKRLQEFDAETNSRRGDLTPKQLEARERRRQFLDEDLRRLEKAMKDAIKDGLKEAAPTIQQQSFDASGLGGGARIWNASLGGGGGFGLPRMQSGGGAEASPRLPRLSGPGGARGGADAGAVYNDPNAFFDAIIKSEGTGKGGRDPYNTSLGYLKPPKPLTEMTMDEVLAWGDHIRKETDIGRRTNSSAKGAFQIVNTTQRAAMAALGITGDEIFSRENQRRMASWIARKQGLGAWEGLKIHPDQMARARSAMGAGMDRQFRDSQGGRPDNPLSRTEAPGRPDNPLSRTEAPGRPDNPLSRTEAPGRPDNPLSRMGDSLMLRSAGAQTIKGDAKVQIDLNGFPKGSRFSTETSGMFKDVTLNRGRQMPDAGEDV